MKEIGIQIFSLRDYIWDKSSFESTIKKLSELGYKSIHTAGLPKDVTPKEYIDILKKNGMYVCGTHYSFDLMKNDIEGTMAHHRLWETTNIGIGGLDVPARTDLSELKSFIKDFNKLAKIYGSEGFRLTYHNHGFEFLRIDGTKTTMDILFEELDPVNTSFVLDTCWVAAGGGDVRHLIEKLAGRIDIIHLKDCYVSRVDEHWCAILDSTEVGNGTLWWDGIIDAARRAGVKHYVVEQDNSADMMASVKQSADYLKKYM